ncbi:MAG TPA: type-F conjugative transfer system pilin assembly protein TrbC [Chlamydiales bacterium]|nr:type-F conjugative transfer system pilin assembly protein TrbC [Chlamydiales bacterium]
MIVEAVAFFLASFIPIATNPSSFLQNLKEKGCPACTSPSASHFKVFMSTSVPLESWKDLSYQLEQTEGIFVLKGLPQDSIELLAKFIFELRGAGVNAPIDIDPENFAKYEIDAVPAIVLEDGEQWDRMIGNLRLDAVLKEFAEKGNTHSKAKAILQRLLP